MKNIFLLFIALLVATVTASYIPLAELRQELSNSIRDIQLNGPPEHFDASLRKLISELDSYQLSPPTTIDLEWQSSIATPLSTKKICFVVSSFEGMYINSGIGTTYYALAHQLVSQGHEVTVLYTRDEPTVGGSWADWTKNYREQGIQLLALPASDKQIAIPKLQATSLRVYRYLAQNPNYDIVHFGDFEAHGFYSIAAKRISSQFVNTAFVVGLHGPTRWTLDSNTARIPTEETEIDLDWMERFSVENADAVWTPSTYIASWLSMKGWKLSSDTLHLLPLPAGPEFNSDISFSASTAVQPKEFVFFGRLETRKGLALFCDALDLLAKVEKNLPKDLIVTFLGSSGYINGTEGEKYIKNRSAHWPFQVKLITTYNRKTALAYLKDSSAQRLPIIPSLADNAPYTVYECLYAGIPFLASDLSSIAPLIVEPLDRATHLFQAKPHQLATMMIIAVRNGVAPVTATFTVAKAESAWNNFYYNVKPKEPIALNTTTPIVSVVIIHYNRPILVQQAIASIEAQNYPNIEIVLVDDGSTDKHAIKFLNEFQAKCQSKNCKLIRGSNQYLGAARNTGARVAQGKYLIFLDDDNTLSPSAISSYVNAAQRTGAKIVTAGHAVFSGTSLPTSDTILRHWVPLGASLAAGLFKNTFGDANFFVERSAFLAVGGFTEEKGVGLEEHEFFANAIFAGQKLEIIPDVLLNYRYHNEKHQMLYTTDIRLGEVRRLRPYLAALTSHSSEVTENVADNEMKKSLVHLVARNAVTPRSQNCNGTITSVSPNSGSVLGGTIITITGTGFSCGVTSVTVDGNDCTGVDIVNNTAITCTTPSGSEVYDQEDIVVVISGDSITLRSAFTYTPSPAPYLVSAILENSGESVIVGWSSPTNQGGASRSQVSCSSLFDNLTQSLIGASATCAFTDDVTISISIAPDSTIKVGDNVTVNAGAVRGKGAGGVANIKSSVVVTADSNETQIAPSVSIKTSSVVASCEGISLDASASSGSGGRPFVSVNWQLTSSGNASQSSIQAIQTVLLNARITRNLTVQFNADEVDIAQYVFTLTLTNWMNVSSSGSVTVTKSSADVPSVSISGVSLVKTFKIDALTLNGVSGGLTCSSDASSVSYSWTVSPAVPALTNTSFETLTVPAGTLTAATTYVFTLSVSSTGSNVVNSASVTVVVVARAIVASITGGTGQYALNSTVTLDASSSYDPESLGPLAFSWKCTTAFNTDCSNISLTTGSTQQFPASSLGTGIFTFTVTVSGTDDRSANAATTITITSIPFLSISISMNSVTSVPIDQVTYLYGAVNQTNVAETDIEWQWSLVTGVIESSDPYQSTTTKTLIINANVLSAGSSYTYKLVATHIPSGTTGTATITFTTQKSSSGSNTCAESVTGGYTYTDVFLFDFGASWALSSGVNQFQVFYQFSNSVVKIPAIPVNTSVSTVTSHLPVGTSVASATASSSTGKTASQQCNITISVAQIATIDADIQVCSNFYDLTREIYSVYNSKSGSDYLSARSDIFQAISRNINAKKIPSILLNSDEFVLIPTDLTIVTNIQNGQLDLTEAIAAGSLLFQTLVLAIFSRSNADSSNDYIQAIGNIAALNTLLLAQTSGLANGAKPSRSVRDDNTLANSINQFNNPSNMTDPYAGVTTAAGLQSAVATSEQQVTSTLVDALPLAVLQTIITDTVSYTFEKNTPTNFDTTGLSMGITSDVVLAAGYVPTSVLKQSVITMKVSEANGSPYALPDGTTLVSKTVNVQGYDSSSSPIDLGTQKVTVKFNSSSSSSSGVNDCIMYTNGNWTTQGVTTTTANGVTSCSFPQIATFALINSASGIQIGQPAASTPTTPETEHKTSLGWIGGVVGGVAAVAIIAVGGAFGVRKYRANQANAVARAPTGGSISAPAPNSPPGSSARSGVMVPPPVDEIFAGITTEAIPNAAAPAALRGSMGVSPAPFALPNFHAAVAAHNDTASQDSSGSADSASSSNSSRSRYSARSTSSEESMEVEIRNIVGELNSNLPRNQRDLEHLGEQLDTE